jgi:glycerol kinase
MARHILAIDQGTTSSRALLFDPAGGIAATAQRELRQYYPQNGWVEHDPEEIWRDTNAVCREALARAGVTAGDVAAIGIANQRETTILWERASGRPIYNAIVWQDRRTAQACRDLRASGVEAMIAAKTGLVVDPYFAATKLAWLLDHVPDARPRAARGELCFGTVDSFLLFRLTGGTMHATDATNAARTMLYDIHRQDWDDELLRLFAIPRALLPRVLDNASDFGAATAEFLGAAVPVTGMAGDQQAAMVGQRCFDPGMVKSTYGTGCFALMNTGTVARASRHRLLTTMAYRVGGRAVYALEGSIFVAGAAIQWLRDELHLISDAEVSARVAATAARSSQVYFVPAFTGLGAPHWAPDVRGAIFGLSRDTSGADLVRAALEAVCFETRDLFGALMADGGLAPTAIRVDGGMARNDWMLQFLADILGLPVERPSSSEATAGGVATLAAIGAGIASSLDAFAAEWQLDRRFTPAMPEAMREARYAGWRRAVEALQRYAGT